MSYIPNGAKEFLLFWPEFVKMIHYIETIPKIVLGKEQTEIKWKR